MSKRVLVCEDDSAIRLLIDKLLSRHGLSPECVETGADAVARLRRCTYDLIILDLLTPVMSGYEVLETLRRERPALLDRIVVITASPQAFREFLPVAAVLRKPFDLAEFDEVVESVLLGVEPRGRVRARTQAAGDWQ